MVTAYCHARIMRRELLTIIETGTGNDQW